MIGNVPLYGDTQNKEFYFPPSFALLFHTIFARIFSPIRLFHQALCPLSKSPYESTLLYSDLDFRIPIISRNGAD
jgi:hypothetical protein